MKFLPAEYASIITLVKSKGYSEDDFSFIKKKGMLYVEHPNAKTPFCFFRKTTSNLNSQGKFEDITSYYIGAKKEQMVETWQDVLDALEDYLTSI